MATLFFVVVDPDGFAEWDGMATSPSCTREENTTQITNLHGPTAKEVGPVIII
jgi:hypothetical protein